MTRKLTLDPESLSIESFESGNAAETHGTVQAHDVKAPCPISGGVRFSCPPSWDCHAEAPLPAKV
ncbi:MAG TPA: hypothetical protein VGO40_07465 [Longimicrobium sp.]|jgi:hypothetical protein|nr:hypothetical protein [Longimicrobium sp.]